VGISRCVPGVWAFFYDRRAVSGAGILMFGFAGLMVLDASVSHGSCARWWFELATVCALVGWPVSRGVSLYGKSAIRQMMDRPTPVEGL